MTVAHSDDLRGKTAVVTGSSRGIGRQIAHHLAAAGAAVLVHGRHPAAAAETAAELNHQHAVATHHLLADLADPATHGPFVQQAWQWRGSVDIWINNAGTDVLTGEAAHWSFARKLEALFQVDVRATMNLARDAGARMKAQGSGAIVNIGWDQAAHGMAGDSGELFAAIKGAVMAFTLSLARSLAPEVRVNCVAPGWIKTSWGEGASDYWQQRAKRESLLERWGAPDDVAAAVRYLVSPAASFVTAQVVNVNGGLRQS